MRWKNWTNLDHVGKEGLEVVEIEVGARELFLDEAPDPFYGRSKGNIRRTGSLVRSTSEQGNRSAEGVDDESSRVITPGERDRIVVVGEDRYSTESRLPVTKYLRPWDMNLDKVPTVVFVANPRLMTRRMRCLRDYCCWGQ